MSSSSSVINNNKMKIFCCYNIIDFKVLDENEKQDLLEHHNRII